ncbi:MAG: hypothetical protein IT368_14095, partial [Candidatus Hydrogenedentes bacterium]|nr:hypothetical protein [Candidatus Hydrogenedentota bacterium]
LRQRLAGFGHRSPSLDYASATWAEMLETGALARVYSYFEAGGDRGSDSAAPRGLMSFVMKPLRRALEMREEQRFTWERVLSRQRALLRQAGEWLQAAGKIGSAEEVWFLYWRELQHLARGGDGPGPGELARRRHAHWVFSACRRPAFVGPHEEGVARRTESILGTGAAGGKGRGVVRLAQHRVPDLRRATEPTILVMRALDPAGTPVLRQVAGVVLERGGLLSHAAIIARELDVPLVVDVPDALDVLEEGWEVEIDGRTGRVEVLHDPV